ncbi:MAG: S8 family serine peptidase [Armatimonadetes bacterium]|nr:S8 family serine peptidase [Armatimonadota bacterium]
MRSTHHKLLLFAALLAGITAIATSGIAIEMGEDGSYAIQEPGVTFVEGTKVDQALESSLASANPVSVIVVLNSQPLHRIAREVQGRYLPEVRQRNYAVRDILAKYAGKRNFKSAEEMREQARREAAAVTAADKAKIKALNEDADALLDEMRRETSRKMRAEVAGEQAQLAADIIFLGGKVNYQYSIENAIAAVVPGTAILQLSQHHLVSHIVADGVDEALMNVSGPSIFVNSFWNAGADGGIWDAAICDTGVDSSHPGLDDDTVAARTWYQQTFHAGAVGQADYNDNSGTTDDLNGHGTHVAGTVFSSSATYRGIAFGADIGMNLKAGYHGTDGKGHFVRSDVRAAMDWAQQQAAEPEVVNYSAGGSVATDDNESSQFFDAFTEAQFCTTSVAAGNAGPGATTVDSPGIAYNAICVANMDDQGTTNRADDTIANSSSRGPTQGGRKKPDITAPGSSIMSTNNGWEGAGSDFVNKSGTSMATPHITGATLLLNDVGVTDPREVKAILINTADDWGAAGWDAAYGWGYVNLDRAYLHRNDSFVTSVTPRNTAGEYKLYKTTGMDAGETATMTWYRHAVYNGSNIPSTLYSLNDLNLRLYDETNNASIDSDIGSLDNVHQVVSDRSGPQVIRAYAWSLSFSHGSGTETFALATQEGTTLAADPTVTPSSSNYTPPLEAKFTASIRVENTGGVAAHAVNVTLSLPAGVVLAEGSLTQNLGSIAAGSSAYAYYKLDTTSSGAKTVTISTSSLSYGLSFTGSGSFTITPGPQDLIDPYTVMRVSGPIYQTGGTDKVANGGFESDLAGWATSGTAVIESGSAHSGSKNLKLGPGSSSAYQTVSVSSSASRAFLTFWYKASASIFASAGCAIQNSSGTTLVYPFSTIFSQGSWAKVVADVGRFKGQTIRVYFYSSTGFFGGNSTLWVDDVSLKENETVWVDGTSQMSLSARDDNSGIDYSQYHVGGDAWATYSSPFTLAGKPESYNYVYYRSVDNGENFEPTITTLLYLDTEAPKSVLRIPSPFSLMGGTEKVSNGGFESNLTGWTTSGAVSAVSSPTRTGARSAKIGETGEGSIYQDVSISGTADRAFVSAWINTVEGTGSSYVRVRIIDPASGLSCYSEGSNFTSSGWMERSWDVSRFKGSTVRLEFGVVHTSGGAATVYVDDVRLRQNGNAYIRPSTTMTIYSAERSGVQKYEYRIDGGGYTASQSFSIAADGLHTVGYRALDNLNHQESEVQTAVNVDSTGPTGSIVINGGAAYTTSTTVTLSLSASDPAGVESMRIRSDTGVWGAWQDYQTSISYTFSSSTEGTKTLSVEFRDVLGNIGSTYSDSINYQVPTAMDIPGAKLLPNGEGVRLKSRIVTAIFPASNYFYIEEPDRKAGIRVRSSTLPADINIYVTVDGVTDTIYAEREIVATNIIPGGVAPEIEPLGMNNKMLGGSAFGNQPAIPGAAVGLNNIGLLVTTTGEVTKHFAGTFYIDDGSPVVDSSPPTPMVLIDRQSLGGWVPPLGSYVSVTGISGASTLSGLPIRIVRPRGVDDIKILQFDAAFVYNTSLTDAQAFEALLERDDIRTDLVPYAKIEATDWSKYDVILIGGDTGSWPEAAKVNAVLGADTPIVAIGEGGGRFLDAAPGLFIGWGQSWSTSATHGLVVGGNIYSAPYNLGVSPGDNIYIYTSPGVSALGLHDPNGASNRMLRELSDANHYLLASEAGRFYQWGFYGSPTAMTANGRKLFVNLVYGTVAP